MDQLAALRVFIRTVESGSLTRAAAELGLPKSTASKLLAQLEQHLGAKLLQRSTRSLALTSEGSDYYERAGQLVASLHDLDTDLQHRRSLVSGRIRVDVHSTMAHAVLIPALADFRARHPGIEVALGISDRPVSLIGEGVDCVVRLGRLADTTLIGRTVYEDHLITCASPDYLRRHGPLTEPTQLRQGHDLVGYFSALSGEAKPLVFQRGADTIKIAAKGFQANDSMGQVSMILHGLGVGQTFRSTVKAHLASGALVPVLEEWTMGTEPISVLYPPAKQQNVRVRAFIDWLVEHLDAQTGRS